jgi:hypothetical protein
MRRPNLALTEQLARAGWRPPHLVRAVNDLLGDGYLSRSTVSEWLHAGRIPREPLPAIIAQFLTEATGRPVSVRELWPHAALAPTWTVPADDGLAQIAAAPCPAIALANDWLHHADHPSGRDRRHFLPVPHTSQPVVDRGPIPAIQVCSDPSARRTADRINSLPATRVTLRFAHRQVLAHAELLITLLRDDDMVSGLTLIIAAAAETAHRVMEHGLAQRYEMSGEILRATTDVRRNPARPGSA